MLKSKLLNQTAIYSIVAGVLATPALAQVDQIVVTATKRAENAQDIPVAVQAIGGDTLDELNVDNFTDYLTQLPGVTNGGSGPGQNTIYIRGVASTTPALSIAGVAGLAPNVALYLDEQPLSQPGRNLDVYAVDLERVEVLPGPQGTLFGASSQAGTVRLITKKPVIGEYQAFANGGLSFTKGGETSQKIEFGANIPVGERAAIRGVFYLDDRGGYIDNVPGSIDLSQSARFRPAGTIRPNGTEVESFRGGFQAGADLSAVNFLSASNDGIVEEDFNDSSYTGFRVSGRYELNDDWRLTAGFAQQDIDADGVFFTDPNLDEYQIQRYESDRIDDDFSNFSWTLEGRLGFLDAVYTGAYTDRDTVQTIDYTEYLLVGQYLPYYLCDSSVSYPGSAAPSGTCQPPNLTVQSTSETTAFTHELRFTTPSEKRVRATAGAFYSDLQLDERNDFTYPNNVNANIFGSRGFFPNFPQRTGFTSEDGPFPPEVIFRNDIRRTDEQFGIFGEVNYDLIPDTLTLTFGARYYDIDVDFEGSANSSFCNSFQADADAFGTDISDLYNGDGRFTFIGDCGIAGDFTFDIADNQSVDDIAAILNAADPQADGSVARATQVFNALRAPDTASTSGVIFKGNVSWTPADGVLLYATYSEGFRPGLLNRPGGAFQAATGFTVPFEVDTDEVTNYELGWKLNLFENQVQFNGSAFYVDVSNLQTTIFDTSIVNLFFSDNAANAEVLGVEGDIIVAPAAIPGLTLAGAFSILDTEITEVLTPTGDVIEGADLAFAPGFQGNLRARYEWNISENVTAHVMPQIIYSGSSRSDIIELNATKVNAYTSTNISAGLTTERWSMEVFAENLFDTYGEISAFAINGPARTTVIRPRTIGLRVGVKY